MDTSIEQLLEAASLPDNFDAFLRRVMKTLREADAPGPDAALALIIAPGENTPGFDLTEGFTREMAQQVTEIDREVVRTGKVIMRTYEQILPSGRYYFNTVKTPLRDAAGRITGVIGIARDITGVKKLESKLALAKALEAVSNETRPMAHDFNNVLAAINGYATMMEEELPDSNPMKREIAQIIRAVKRATQLTSRLQTFARNPRLARQNTDKT